MPAHVPGGHQPGGHQPGGHLPSGGSSAVTGPTGRGMFFEFVDASMVYEHTLASMFFEDEDAE